MRNGACLTLKLDLVLNHEGLALVVELLGELGGDGMVSSGVLDDKSLVALHALVGGGLLHGPGTDVGPLLVTLGGGGVLLGVGRLPPFLPVISELLKEVGLEGGGLDDGQSAFNCTLRSAAIGGHGWSSICCHARWKRSHTLKVGRSGTTTGAASSSCAWATPASRPADTAAAMALNFILGGLEKLETELWGSRKQASAQRSRTRALGGGGWAGPESRMRTGELMCRCQRSRTMFQE